MVLQHDLIDFIIPTRLEQLAELWHSGGAAVGQNLEADELVIDVSVMRLGLLCQQFHQLHTFLLAVDLDVVDEELQVLLEDG